MGDLTRMNDSHQTRTRGAKREEDCKCKLLFVTVFSSIVPTGSLSFRDSAAGQWAQIKKYQIQVCINSQ